MDSFSDLADIFDAMIDWPKRLAHEAPFFRSAFAGANVKSVLDVACGPGKHAAMFHSWGLRVDGADISPRMIEKAVAEFGRPAGLRWAVRSYEEPADAPGSFDAAVCLGNSLALADDLGAVGRAMGRMFEAIRPGGLVIAHVLNVWALPDGPVLWQKCRPIPTRQGQRLILKGVHRCPARSFVDLALADPAGQAPLQSQSVPFLNLKADDLASLAKSAGAAEIRFFGGYKDEPYDPVKSVDLILMARKAAKR